MLSHWESAAGRGAAGQKGTSHLQPTAYSWRRGSQGMKDDIMMFPNEMKSLCMYPKHGPESVVKQNCFHVTWTGFPASKRYSLAIC